MLGISKQSSIESKLRRIILMTISVALFVAGLGFAVNDFFRYQDIETQELESLAGILSEYAQVELEFNDSNDARKILAGLASDERISYSVLYDNNGEVFAYYQRDPLEFESPPLKLPESGHHFGLDTLTVVKPITDGQKRMGTLVIQASLVKFYQRLSRYLLIVFAVLVASFCGALYFSSYLQDWISKPILRLAETASRVSQENDFSLRAGKETGDEVGLLVDQFNTMLEQIESRDQALKKVNEELDKRVQERTANLTELNKHLQLEVGIRKQAEDVVRSQNRVLDLLAKGHSLGEALDALVVSLEKQIVGEAICGIFLLDETGRQIQLESGPHLPKDLGKLGSLMPMIPDSDPTCEAIDRNFPVIIEDIQSLVFKSQYSSGWQAHDIRSVWALPIHDAEGRVQGALTLFLKGYPRRPNTEDNQLLNSAAYLAGTAVSRKRIEEELNNYARELARSNRDLEEFASIASHDLQEPLRKVMAFGQRLVDCSQDSLGEEGEKNLERMLNATKRMKRFIDDLLDYSRLSGQPRPFSPTNLNHVIENVLFDLELTLEVCGGEVEVQKLPVIDADGTRMHQVFLNLINNAIKFKKEETPPRIKIYSSQNASGKLEIIVEDNGIGFDNSFQDRIFKPFERLHGMSKYEGTGIGLALCRKIIERHGGTIRAEGQPGVGTRIIISLSLPSSGSSKHPGETLRNVGTKPKS